MNRMREDAGDPEERGDLTLGPPLGVLVDVGRARLVRGQARVGDRVAALTLVVRDDVAPVVEVGHALTPFLERTECEAIQTAKPTSRPMPITQPARPSVTGPREPSVLPP